jgi:hypothetical protein
MPALLHVGSAQTIRIAPRSGNMSFTHPPHSKNEIQSGRSRLLQRPQILLRLVPTCHTAIRHKPLSPNRVTSAIARGGARPDLDAQVHNESQACRRRVRSHLRVATSTRCEQNCSPRSRRTHLNIGYQIDRVLLRMHSQHLFRCASPHDRAHSIMRDEMKRPARHTET